MALLWLLITIGNNLLLRATSVSARGQSHIIYEGSAGLKQATSLRTLLIQLAFAMVVFATSEWLADDFFSSLYAGGWVIAAAVAFANNLRALLWTKAMARPDYLHGSLVVGKARREGKGIRFIVSRSLRIRRRQRQTKNRPRSLGSEGKKQNTEFYGRPSRISSWPNVTLLKGKGCVPLSRLQI